MTSAEVAAHQARFPDPSVPVVTAADQHEEILHDMIAAECERRGWLALHGSMRHRTYRTVGEPDFEIWAEGGRTIHVEAKASGGKPSEKQLELHAWAHRLGHTVHVVRTLAEFIAVCKI